jgi:hypothetical protein
VERKYGLNRLEAFYLKDTHTYLFNTWTVGRRYALPGATVDFSSIVSFAKIGIGKSQGEHALFCIVCGANDNACVC